jgi:hypothetical protein
LGKEEDFHDAHGVQDLGQEIEEEIEEERVDGHR